MLRRKNVIESHNPKMQISNTSSASDKEEQMTYVFQHPETIKTALSSSFLSFILVKPRKDSIGLGEDK